MDLKELIENIIQDLKLPYVLEEWGGSRANWVIRHGQRSIIYIRTDKDHAGFEFSIHCLRRTGNWWSCSLYSPTELCLFKTDLKLSYYMDSYGKSTIKDFAHILYSGILIATGFANLCRYHYLLGDSATKCGWSKCPICQT